MIVAKSMLTTFVDSLNHLLVSRQISPQGLASKVGTTEHVFLEILQSKHRPNKETVIKLAEALAVAPTQLWSNLSVLDMLDTVASFEEDGYAMTEEEANAFGPNGKRNGPKIPVKSLTSI